VALASDNAVCSAAEQFAGHAHHAVEAADGVEQGASAAGLVDHLRDGVG